MKMFGYRMMSLFLDTYPCDPTATFQGRGGESRSSAANNQVTQTSVLAAPLASVLTSKEWHWNHETHGNRVKILWKGVFSLIQPKPHFMCVCGFISVLPRKNLNKTYHVPILAPAHINHIKHPTLMISDDKISVRLSSTTTSANGKTVKMRNPQ